MANPIIDLRKLKEELKGGIDPANELPAPSGVEGPAPSRAEGLPPPEEMLIETAEAAHPEEFADAEERQSFPALLEWEAHEFEHDEFSAPLLFLFGALLVVGGIVTLFFNNILFALFLFLAGGLTISYAYKPPRHVRFAVTSRGVQIGKRVYGFDSLDSFWIHYDPPLFKELSIRSKKTFVPHIRAPLGDLDPLRLRAILLRFLKEEEHEHSVIDILSKRIGF